MPKGIYKRVKKREQASQEEIDFCQTCPFPDCTAKNDGTCELLRKELKNKE